MTILNSKVTILLYDNYKKNALIETKMILTVSRNLWGTLIYPFWGYLAFLWLAEPRSGQNYP